MESVPTNYYKDAFKQYILQKSKAATGISMFVQILVLLAYLAIINATPLHPILWIKTIFGSLFSVKILICTFCLIFITAFKVLYYVKFTATVPINTSRFYIAMRFFSVDNIVCILLHLLMGIIFGTMFINLDSNKENNAFKIFATTFTSLYFYFHNPPSFMHIPLMSGLKLKSRIKLDVYNAFKSSIWPGVVNVLYCTLLYFFFESYINPIFSIFLDLNDSANNSNIIIKTFNVYRLISSYILCVNMYFVLLSMKSIVLTTLTRRFQLPLTNNNDWQRITIQDGLKMNDMPFIQQLLSYEFFMIAENDPRSRAELYLLSSPGNHPYIWQSMVQPFLELIENMCQELSLVPTPSPSQTQVNDKPKVVDPIKDEKETNTSMRNLSMYQSSHEQITVINDTETYFDVLNEWIKLKFSSLFKKSPLFYLFGERQELKVANTLINKGQCIGFLIRGFSTMIQVSVTEDNYGIIQQSLPAIISSILKLKTAVDKLSPFYRKQNISYQQCYYMKAFLRDSIVQSLYKIVVTYKKNLDEITLPVEVRKQLSNFLQYKES